MHKKYRSRMQALRFQRYAPQCRYAAKNLHDVHNAVARIRFYIVISLRGRVPLAVLALGGLVGGLELFERSREGFVG